MKIVIDAMGGDRAPAQIVAGAIEGARRYPDVSIVLVGDRDSVSEAAKPCGKMPKNVEIVHASTVIRMDDDPMSILREKVDCSMAVGLRMLNEDADAFISAGSTGALHASSNLIVRRIRGVHRSAIATVLPFSRPVLLLDAGANPNVTAEYLHQWAKMGSIYMKELFDLEEPQVGLLNNGTEEGKGTTVAAEAYTMLKNDESICFVGNIESKEIPFGPCDVLVTDGFTGNITLKLAEGMGKFFFSKLKSAYGRNTLTKLSFGVMKEPLMELRREFDASEYGGAPLIGLRKPVIKAHGNSDAKAIANAVKQAIRFAEGAIPDKIAEALS